MLNRMLKMFAAGVAFMGGVCFLGSIVAQTKAATLAYVSTSGIASDPITMINNLIQQINSKIALAGTATPSTILSIPGTPSVGYGTVQFANSNAWTSTTSTCGSITSSTACLATINNLGVVKWIPAF